MDRVGLVVLSIAMAPVLLLGASLGALYLQPLDMITRCIIAAVMTLLSLGLFFVYRRRRS